MKSIVPAMLPPDDWVAAAEPLLPHAPSSGKASAPPPIARPPRSRRLRVSAWSSSSRSCRMLSSPCIAVLPPVAPSVAEAPEADATGGSRAGQSLVGDRYRALPSHRCASAPKPLNWMVQRLSGLKMTWTILQSKFRRKACPETPEVQDLAGENRYRRAPAAPYPSRADGGSSQNSGGV